MSSCANVRGDLPLFVGGDLDRVRAATVRRHLCECAQCRREASSLQQPLLQLQAFGGRHDAARGDDAWFAGLQRGVMDRIGAELRRDSVRRRPVPSPVWWAAAAIAAVAAFLAGWSWMRPDARPDVLVRAPIAAPVGSPGPAKVVPYSGDRVPLQLLGDEPGASSAGSGMMGRWRLRALVGEEAAAGPPPR